MDHKASNLYFPNALAIYIVAYEKNFRKKINLPINKIGAGLFLVYETVRLLRRSRKLV